jgi:F-actin monooxygenase
MALRIQSGGTPTIHLVGPGSISTLSVEDQARAEKFFDAFCEANSLKNITSLFQKLCECVKLRPNDYRTFYTRLKERMSFSWKWKSFQGKLDKRTNQKEYGKGTYCSGNKVSPSVD